MYLSRDEGAEMKWWIYLSVLFLELGVKQRKQIALEETALPGGDSEEVEGVSSGNNGG